MIQTIELCKQECKDLKRPQVLSPHLRINRNIGQLFWIFTGRELGWGEEETEWIAQNNLISRAMESPYNL